MPHASTHRSKSVKNWLLFGLLLLLVAAVYAIAFLKVGRSIEAGREAAAAESSSPVSPSTPRNE